MTGQRQGPKLGKRADAVFDAWLSGEDAALHPADRAEASAFWNWLGEFERPELARPEPRIWPRWAAVAALIVSVGTSVGWYARPVAQVSVVQSFASGHAERRAVRLADGSTVTLAADSRVDIAFTAGERRLMLRRGKALFDVAHNPARPFVVATSHGEVRAIGTAFDVAIGVREARVTVVEGVVRIALPGNGKGAGEPIEKLARKGERLAFGVSAGGGNSVGFISQDDDADIEGATAWTRGQLVFHGEPLHEVIAEINRYARDRVVLTDPRAADTPVFGVVDQGDTAAIRDLVANPRAVAIERID